MTHEDKEKKSNSRLTIAERLAKAALEIRSVGKEKGVGMKYDFTSHDFVASVCRVPLFSNGIVLVCEQSYDATTKVLIYSVKFCCADRMEEFIPFNQIVTVTSIGGSAAIDCKAFGAATSYAYKYILQKALMLSSGEDDIELQDRTISADNLLILKTLMGPIPGREKSLCAAFNVKKIEDIRDCDFTTASKKIIRENTIAAQPQIKKAVDTSRIELPDEEYHQI